MIRDTVSAIIEISKRRLCDTLPFSTKWRRRASGPIVEAQSFFLISEYHILIILSGTGMKAEQWLNRADHELVLAQELLNAGSFLWAASYAHRALEYTLEGLIVMKTGVRPERGSTLSDLHHATRQYIPDSLNQPINALSEITPLAWQSDISAEQIAFLTEKRVSVLIEAGKTVLSWAGDEWSKELASTPSSEDDVGHSA